MSGPPAGAVGLLTTTAATAKATTRPPSTTSRFVTGRIVRCGRMVSTSGRSLDGWLVNCLPPLFGPVPNLMAGRLGMPRSAIYVLLHRRRLARLRDLDRATGVPIRYERDCPGELVHVDIKRLAKVPDGGGGWRIHGRGRAGRTQQVGYEYVHSMVDDHSRFAYSEIHDNQASETCAGFILRAAQTFATHGYRIDRVMTDNAWGYRKGKAFADALTHLGAAHKLNRPYRPRPTAKSNGSAKPWPTDGPINPLQQQPGPRPSPHRLLGSLQSPQTPQRPRRQTPHHPSCQPPL